MEELQRLHTEHEDLLRPEDIVAFATNEKTALHNKFTWDNRRAGHAYRIWQARQLIRVSIQVLGGQPQRIFYSLRSDRVRVGGGYRTTVQIMSDREQRQELLRDALMELSTFRRKYMALQELAEVFAVIDKILPAPAEEEMTA